ncbi:hypothetical protein [Tissierella sp.]|uniref:hypothetical protein n=1 Tax=Tissierella sp. TaxID=41274 RepID=UPI0028B213C8|nr:hypothetical protein [Tissierella sp.]
MNEKIRKYQTEFGLNTYVRKNRLIPVWMLDEIEDNTNYHIYMILSAPKTYIKNGEIIKKDNKLNFKFMQIKDEEEVLIEVRDFPFNEFFAHPEIDYNKVNYKSAPPYNIINVYGDDIDFNIHVDDIKVIYDNMQYKKFETEILYIGKSYGVKKKRTAIDRLKSHETLQKILAKQTSNLNNSIYLYLLEIMPILNTTMDGLNKRFDVDDETNVTHMKDVLESEILYDQVINITEAAMINYFKPTYNKEYIENFPNQDHKGYTQYFNLDFNSIVVEIDTSEFPNLRLYTEHNSLNSPFEYIEYNLFNDKNRKNMYDIFIEKKTLSDESIVNGLRMD